MEEQEQTQKAKDIISKYAKEATAVVVENSRLETKKHEAEHGLNETNGGEMEPILLFEFFDVDGASKSDPEVVNRLRFIYDFAKDRVGQDDVGVKDFLNKIKIKIGAPRVGETHLNHVYRYVKLLTQSKQVNQELSEYETKNSNNR